MEGTVARMNPTREGERRKRRGLYDEKRKSRAVEAPEGAGGGSEAEARAAAMEAEVMQAKVAASTDVDPDLLSESSEEAELRRRRGRRFPRALRLTQEFVGEQIRAVKQLTRGGHQERCPQKSSRRERTGS